MNIYTFVEYMWKLHVHSVTPDVACINFYPIIYQSCQCRNHWGPVLEVMLSILSLRLSVFQRQLEGRCGCQHNGWQKHNMETFFSIRMDQIWEAFCFPQKSSTTKRFAWVSWVFFEVPPRLDWEIQWDLSCVPLQRRYGRAVGWVIDFPRDAQEYPGVVNETPVQAVWVSRVEQEQVLP